MTKNKKYNKNLRTKSLELLYAEDLQSYGYILKSAGDGRFIVHCFLDDKQRIGLIRGSLRKRTFIKENDYVLISLRESLNNDSKCDIIHKYNEDEVRELKSQNEILREAVRENCNNNDFIDFGDI